jgi:hypothetical protein
MSDNVIDLIRGVNPFPDELPAPAIEPIRHRLEGGNRGPRSPARKARLPTLDATVGALGVATAVAVAVLVIALLGHSRSRTATSHVAASAASTTSAAPFGLDNLSGTWSGHFSPADYSGGTLLISWRQSGWKQTSPGIWHSNLNGTIKLSNLPPYEILLIRGTVLTTCRHAQCHEGITFHTVGVKPSLSVLGGGWTGNPIVYNGSVSANDMHGTYQWGWPRGFWRARQLGR